MKKSIVLVLGISVFVVIGFFLMATTLKSGKDAKKKGSDKISWMTFDQGVERAKKEKKLLVVDFYTDWCHWCKVMVKETFANKEVVKFAKEHVIMAKLNAETSEKFRFKDAKYNGMELSQMFGVRGFPTTAFLNSDGELLTTVSGYIPADRFTLILRYLAGNWHDKMKFDEFVKQEQGKNKS